jgi:predicted amidohydrolase
MPVIAIAQIPMHWEMADNVVAIKQALRIARDDGAAICAFAELAVTGFHRRIAEWARPERSGPALV